MMLYLGLPYPSIKLIRFRVLGWSNPYREKYYRHSVNYLLEEMIHGEADVNINNDFNCQHIPWKRESDDLNEYVDVLFDTDQIQPTEIQARFEAAGLRLTPAEPFYRGFPLGNVALIILFSPLLIVGQIFMIVKSLFDEKKPL